MKFIHSTKFQAVLYLTVLVAVFGIAYSILGQSQGGGGTPTATERPEQSDGEKLMHAIVGDDDKMLESLLKAGANPNEVYEGSVPLQIALESESETNYRKVRLLLEHGADPNLVVDGRTPMHSAARNGTEPIVKALLDAGGDPNIATAAGFTPYEEAVASGNEGASSAIGEKFPGEMLSDKRKWDSLKIGGVVTKGMTEAVAPRSNLTDAQKKARVRATVDKLVSEGLVPASTAEQLYQQMVEKMEDGGLIEGGE